MPKATFFSFCAEAKTGKNKVSNKNVNEKRQIIFINILSLSNVYFHHEQSNGGVDVARNRYGQVQGNQEP